MHIFELIFDFILISIAGLLIAFSPMLIITDLLIVLRSKRPILHAVVLLVSIATPLLLLAIVATTFIKPDTTITLSSINDKLSIPPTINLICGVILAIIGWRHFRQLKYRPLQPGKDIKPSKSPPTKVLPLFIFGFMKTLFSLTNVVAILFVTKLIVSNKLSPGLALLIVAWTIAVGMVPFFAIFYYQKNRHEYLLRLQANLDARMSLNVKAYAYMGLTIIGVILVMDSFVQLMGKF